MFDGWQPYPRGPSLPVQRASARVFLLWPPLQGALLMAYC